MAYCISFQKNKETISNNLYLLVPSFQPLTKQLPSPCDILSRSFGGGTLFVVFLALTVLVPAEVSRGFLGYVSVLNHDLV